jgi:membrane-associated protein
MTGSPAFLSWLLNSQQMLDHFGAYALWGAVLVVFVECWLFPFLPGDSLLFTVGLLIANNERVNSPIWAACLVLSVSAVLSNVVGYLVGARIGARLFDRPDSRIFKPAHIARTHVFFERYGNRAVFLGRFVPIVRTFITLAAGTARMPMRRFVGYSALGGVVWASGVTLLGFWLGRFDVVHQHIELMLVLVVLVSLIPIVVEWARERRRAPAEPVTRP